MERKRPSTESDEKCTNPSGNFEFGEEEEEKSVVEKKIEKGNGSLESISSFHFISLFFSTNIFHLLVKWHRAVAIGWSCAFRLDYYQ